MSQVIHELHQDHLNVMKLLDFLESTVDRVDIHCGEGVQLCHDIVHYLTHYTDIFHHPIEDQVFDLLQERDTSVLNTIQRLKNEHESLILAGQKLLGILQRATTSQDLDIGDLENLIHDYTNILRKHMLTEEVEIFPLAKVLLTPQDDKIIRTRCARKLDPIFGNAAHTQYERLEKLISEELRSN